MAFGVKKTEHGGHKGSGRKTGFWGLRIDAKWYSRKVRRMRDRTEVKKELELEGGE